MFAPKAVQQHTREQAPAQTRQTAQELTHGLTPTEPVRGSVPFLQRYLGNSALQSLSIGSKAPQESAVPSVVHDVVRSPGQPLDPTTRTTMESRFDADFSQVRVHTDAKAAESARAVYADAYTVGSHVVFGAGRYQPGPPARQWLLAHELTHVVQQSNRSWTSQELRIVEASDPSEQEAERVATHVTIGAPTTVRAGVGQSLTTPVVQRFDPRHHRSALIKGLRDSGLSAASIGAIDAANWERDFSQTHPALAGVVIAWKELKAALDDGDAESIKAASDDLNNAALACLNPKTLKNITNAAYGENPFYSHMDNPVGEDLDPSKTWMPWEKDRRTTIRNELLKMTPDNIPQYLADARDYVHAQLIRAVEATLGMSLGTSHWSKTRWERRKRELAGKVPPPQVAEAMSPDTAIIAAEATAEAKQVMKPGNANSGLTLPAEAVDALGRASHALEDFFSHSNFVDTAIGYDADFRRAAGPATDTSLHTGTFGSKSAQHSLTHKIHALVNELQSHPQMPMVPQARLGVQALKNLATKFEGETMEDDSPGSHTRLAKDQPAWSKMPLTLPEQLKTLRFMLAHQCAVAADREIIGGVIKVITADRNRADAHMQSVSKQLFKMIAPPTASHPLWNILTGGLAKAAKLIIAQMEQVTPRPVPSKKVVVPNPPAGPPLLKKQ